MQHAVHYVGNVSSYGDSSESDPWMPQENIAWVNLVVRAHGGRDRVKNLLESAYQQDASRAAQLVTNLELRQALLARSLAVERFDRGFSGLRQPYATALLLLMAIVGLVLLIAAANVANLFTARAATRQHEMRVRRALGATRRHLVPPLLAEALILTAGGAAAGLLLARRSSAALGPYLLDPALDSLPPAFAIDLRVVAFTMAISLATATLFAVAPALRMSSVRLADGSRSPAGLMSPRSMTSMRPLLVAQVALCVVCVVAAVWFGRSLVNLSRLDPGFERARLVTISLSPANSGYTARELPALYERVATVVRSLAGVEDAVLRPLRSRRRLPKREQCIDRGLPGACRRGPGDAG